MELQNEMLVQLTRIADALEGKENMRELTENELYRWWNNLSEQKCEFLNARIKNEIGVMIMATNGAIAPEETRFIRNYI